MSNLRKYSMTYGSLHDSVLGQARKYKKLQRGYYVKGHKSNEGFKTEIRQNLYDVFLRDGYFNHDDVRLFVNELVNLFEGSEPEYVPLKTVKGKRHFNDE